MDFLCGMGCPCVCVQFVVSHDIALGEKMLYDIMLDTVMLIMGKRIESLFPLFSMNFFFFLLQIRKLKLFCSDILCLPIF